MTVTTEIAGPAPIDSRGADLSRLMRHWRARLNPSVVMGSSGSGRRKRVLSQEDMARLIASSSHWYARLERGDTGIFSPDFLDRTATALRLSASERRMLYLLAVGYEPADIGQAATSEATMSLRNLVDMQRVPAYITDETWNVVSHNGHAVEWFPWLAQPGANVMRWAFTSLVARTQLHNWETDWAPPMLGQMMAARARLPRNPVLALLVADILKANVAARRMWNSGSGINVRADGGRRQLNLPVHGEIRDVEVLAMSPLHAPALTMTLIVPALA